MSTKSVACAAVLWAAAAAAQPPAPQVSRALASISADSLRGNLSFIAADLLGGRDTPSPGLDIAALYIAAQFRKAALEPAGDDGYFQTAKMLRISAAGAGFELSLQNASRTLAISADRAEVISRQPVDLAGVPLYKIAGATDLQAAKVKGNVVMLGPDPSGALLRAAAVLLPAAFLEVRDDLPRFIDVDEEEQLFGDVPRLILRQAEAVKLLKDVKAGPTGFTVSIKLPTPTAVPLTVRNVAALLRGSDPALRGEYILLTAHYDHLGHDSAGRVFPGANDDGSGVVSVIEIAQALSAAGVHLKRSIVFMTFFGEEEGGLGSYYYARHPLFPLTRTVADLNLEQLGRTDSKEGPEMANATLTGFRYSTVAATLQRAGQSTGVKVYETPHGDDYFNRSDNQAFAEHGIPAHTLAVAFEFPDYHAIGDTWPKIDYGNMARVDRMIALGIVMMADSTARPRWNAANPKVAKYLKAK